MKTKLGRELSEKKHRAEALIRLIGICFLAARGRYRSSCSPLTLALFHRSGQRSAFLHLPRLICMSGFRHFLNQSSLAFAPFVVVHFLAPFPSFCDSSICLFCSSVFEWPCPRNRTPHASRDRRETEPRDVRQVCAWI